VAQDESFEGPEFMGRPHFPYHFGTPHYGTPQVDPFKDKGT
jgi:hypothetical protein